MSRRKLRKLWTLLAIAVVIAAIAYIAIVQPAIDDLAAGMCKTYFPDEPGCMERLNETRPSAEPSSQRP